MSIARAIQKQETYRNIFGTLHAEQMQGAEATSVDQIVLGVSKGSFCVHFPMKLFIFTTYVDHPD